ncbi:hypothetical protein F383_34495 [Gossypium arboreum]|uniref:Uncharacterized protein n=1 Tax=Gossypium arboreum TaxID=29729 RepID=A0A0B0PSM5_GOSAR|nr:hypothetical protein F383_34495 [Gossypium arboreum]
MVDSATAKTSSSYSKAIARVRCIFCFALLPLLLPHL